MDDDTFLRRLLRETLGDEFSEEKFREMERQLGTPAEPDPEILEAWVEFGRRGMETGECIGGYAFFNEGVHHLWAYGGDARIDKTACGRVAVHDMMQTGTLLMMLNIADDKNCPACVAAWRDAKAATEQSKPDASP